MISYLTILKLLESETPYNLCIVYDNHAATGKAFRDVRRHLLDENIAVNLRAMSITKGETVIRFTSCAAPEGINHFRGVDADFLIMDDLHMRDEAVLRQRAEEYWRRRE